MSYAVYSTKAFILGSAASGEASKVYHLYTEDFGLVRARAQGVRLLSSKLRYNLEDYSLAQISLVRGKEVWRLTGAEKLASLLESKEIMARVLNLVKRLVQGEEKNEKLFQALTSITEKTPEPLILAGVLDSLGYLDIKKIRDLPEGELIKEINKALKETHL